MTTPTFHNLDTTAAEQPADRGSHGPAIGRLLLCLWGITAVGLVVLPFLTQVRVRSLYGDQAGHEGMPNLEDEYSIDGWGQMEGLDTSGPRVGILFVGVAALLILAVVATASWRRATWPIWIGLLANTLSVTASVLQLLELEAMLLNEDVGDASVLVDVTVGPVAWLIVTLGALATVAAALSLVWLRNQRLRRPQGPTPRAATVERPPAALVGACLAAALGLAVAPFLPFLQFGGNEIDGWDRSMRSVGLPCTVLSLGLVVTAIAVMTWRAAAWPLRIGTLAGTGAVGVAGFQLISLAPILGAEDYEPSVSAGVGAWLVLTAGVLAAAAVVLTLIRQRRLELD